MSPGRGSGATEADTWSPGLLVCEAYLCPPILLILDSQCTTSILWWVVARLAWLSQSDPPDPSGLRKITGAVFQKVYNSSRQMLWLCSITSGTQCILPLLISLKTTGSDDSYGPNSRVICTIAWKHCRALSYLGPHSKVAGLCVTARYMGHGNIPRCAVGYIYNPKRPTKHGASFFMVRSRTCSHLSYTSEEISWHALDHWIPKNFTDVAGSESSQGLSSGVRVSCHGYQCVSHFLIIVSDQHNIIL